MGETWQKNLVQDLDCLNAKGVEATLRVLVMFPATEAQPNVIKLCNFNWLLYHDALRIYLHGETWFEGFVECCQPSANGAFKRQYQVAILTLKATRKSSETIVVEKLALVKATAMTELGFTLVVDYALEDEEDVHGTIETWFESHTGEDWPVAIVDEKSNQSPAHTPKCPRRCLYLPLIRPSRPDVRLVFGNHSVLLLLQSLASNTHNA